jgi:hypothetical protein
MVEYRSIAEIRCKSRDEHAGPDLLLMQEGGMTQQLGTHRLVLDVVGSPLHSLNSALGAAVVDRRRVDLLTRLTPL